MSVCTFDNPATWQRECWQDGRLIYALSADFYFLREWTVPADRYFFGANVGPWKTGRMVGDASAIGEPPHD